MFFQRNQAISETVNIKFLPNEFDQNKKPVNKNLKNISS